ncbi:putative ornithine cyclodeaminase [Cupriavidus taiwanensis]|uniref:Ornithine cyclodeaminase n=1 Tax=Cupriavidus taiwanensis TaxID=164546 RepID=A0A375CRF9_9BURK|nr:ornithine cyclodeaminase family protein [Cupriavidus taiwanensis]SOY77691.1 putative ornithine cyclodeaminase [Cupriavidus taiwanensis]
MLILDAKQTSDRLPFDKLITALDSMFAQGCTVPLRHNHQIEVPGSEDPATLLIMPAWQVGGRLGIKTVSVYPDNAVKGLPGLHSTYILFDAANGMPLAMLDGDAITSCRTAAATAVAAKYLSRTDSRRLLLLGTGRVGSLVPYALRAVRDIKEVEVWDTSMEKAANLVQALRGEGFEASAVQDLERSSRRADIISCATLSKAPLIKGEWLQPGVHLDLIGAFTPEMRESDDECFSRAEVFVDTDEAVAKAGDILSPIAAGRFDPKNVRARMEQLCRTTHPGRKSQEEITLFKAVGTALEDLAAASLVYDA